MFFFFKQKTAYEMRISDWSSDVCSSDLGRPGDLGLDVVPRRGGAVLRGHFVGLRVAGMGGVVPAGVAQIDATHEGHVARGVVPVPQHDQLLVVGASRSEERRVGTECGQYV